MQVLGLCRFSYPALGGFQREHQTRGERQAYLYDTSRLIHRFRLFESLCLPSITSQTDRDFTFLILTGDDLPAWALDRLHGLVDDYPFIQVILEPPQDHRVIASRVINEYRRWAKPLCAQFRLDDDDAVHTDFVHRLKEKAINTAPLFPNDRKFAIDFSRGYAAQFTAQTISLSSVEKPFWTPALAAVFRKGSDKTIMSYSHHKLGQRMPWVNDTSEPMFIRSFHHDNDSAARGAHSALEPETIPIEQIPDVIKNFGTTVDKIKQIWTDDYAIVPAS
jgi:hypothetical protein